MFETTAYISEMGYRHLNKQQFFILYFPFPPEAVASLKQLVKHILNRLISTKNDRIINIPTDTKGEASQRDHHSSKIFFSLIFLQITFAK